jgi:hypothetical protein
MTDDLQPLDRYVFGHLKSTGKRLFRLYVQRHITEDIVINKQLAIQFLIEAWKTIGKGTLVRAWNIYPGSQLAAAMAESEMVEMTDDDDDLI